MINIIVISIFIFIILIAYYNISLGYSLLVAVVFLVPLSAVMSPVISAITKLTLAMSVILFITYFKNNREFKGIPKTLTKPILIYLSSCLFLFIFSTAVPKVFQLREYLNETIFLMYGIAAYIVFNKARQIDTFIYIMACSIFLVSIYAVITYYLKINPYVLLSDIAYGAINNQYRVEGLEMDRGFLGARIQSTFDHPLTLGQIFAIAFGFFAMISNKINKYLYYTLAITIVSIIILTGSRSAIVSLFPTVIVILSFLNWRIKILFVLSFILGLFFLENNVLRLPSELNRSLQASVMFWDDKLQQKANYTGSSIEMRLNQLEAVEKKLSRTNPLTGYGLGFRDFNQIKSGGLDPELLGYESILFLKMVEQGLIGFFFIFFLLFQLYRLVQKRNGLLSKKEIFLHQAYFLSYIIGATMTGVRYFSFLIFIIFYIVFIRYLQLTPTDRIQKKV